MQNLNGQLRPQHLVTVENITTGQDTVFHYVIVLNDTHGDTVEYLARSEMHAFWQSEVSSCKGSEALLEQ